LGGVRETKSTEKPSSIISPLTNNNNNHHPAPIPAAASVAPAGPVNIQQQQQLMLQQPQNTVFTRNRFAEIHMLKMHFKLTCKYRKKAV
jgi:hypothetical protein